MKRILARAALAATAFGLSAVAQAVPIVFEFSGDVNGQRASGTISFETEGLTPLLFQQQLSFSNYAPGNQRSGPFIGTYTYGGETVTLGDDPLSDYGNVNFNDTCQPECEPNWSENWALNLISLPPAPDQPVPPGAFTQYLSFMSMSPFDPTTGIAQDYFDINDITIESVLTLPLRELTANYQSGFEDCSSGTCFTQIVRSETFVVETLTRRIGTVSVPEPGTFGLFAAGVAGAFALRRRRPLLQR